MFAKMTPDPARPPLVGRSANRYAELIALYSNPMDPKVRRARIWLGEMLKEAALRKKSFGEEAPLTPELAAILLLKNESNRLISDDTVAKYSSDVRAGRWPCNGQTVIVAMGGYLNDGQHRCLAVVETGCTIPKAAFWIGAERETRMTVDQGKKRTPGDVATMKNTPNGNVISHAARLLHMFDEHGRIVDSPRLRPTQQQINETMDQHRGLQDSLSAIGSRKVGRASRGMLTFAHYIFARMDRSRADEFMKGVMTGIGLSGDNPVLALRNRLIDDKKLHSRGGEGLACELMIRSWNAWVAGEARTKMQLGDSFPTVRKPR